MSIAKYCKEKGMSKEEYKQFTYNIKEVAKAIRSTLSYKGGMYYKVSDLFNWNADADMKHFIIQELKNLGIEFFNDNIEYRVTE
jgi:hypothetical protein